VLQLPQDAAATAAAPADFAALLQSIGWVDRTALAVLLVFFVIGLFKGLVWQVSRILILVAAYVVAGRFGHDLGAMLARSPAGGASTAGAPELPEATLYLAYVLLFVAVLIVLSLLAMLVQRIVKSAGLSFFDRLGGGVFGIATGASVVLFALFVLNMFARGSKVAEAAESSHSLRLSRRAIDWLGTHVHDDLRLVLALAPLDANGPPALPSGSAPPDRAPSPSPLPGALGEPPGGTTKR
jgi:membrane protein required for colicin V production